MDSPLPFFYYDILSRIVPGAATLSVLWRYQTFPPMHWLRGFVSNTGQKDWQEVVVPIVLVGLCYVIGVIYEVFDYFPDARRFPGMKWFSNRIDDRAFLRVWCEEKDALGDSICALPRNWDEVTRRRSELWNELTYMGGSQPEMTPVFAHCHRFQAEQKMFLHLLYPALLFWIMSLCHCEWREALIGLIALCLFFFCCCSRSRRRWLQVVAFSKITKAKQELPKPKSETVTASRD